MVHTVKSNERQPMAAPAAATVLADLPRVGSRDLSARIAAAQQRGIVMLRLAPYPLRTLPPHVVAAIEEGLAENDETPSQGIPALRCAIAQRVGTEIGREIHPDTQILVTNGAMQALNVTFRALLHRGDEVLVPSPCYFFHGCIELAGGVAVHVPMTEESGFTWDVDALADAITPRTRALVVNTPVNPTGHVLSHAELADLAELAQRYGLWIIADESYDRLVYDGRRHESIAALPEVREQTVLIRSCTKSYAMPAWRIGYLIASAALVARCIKALEWEMLCVNRVAQMAAAAAIGGPQDWLADVPAEFQAARDRLLGSIAGMEGISCVPPQGGPFLFLNTSRLFASSQAASDALLEVGLPTVPGHYCQSDAHVRLAFGAPPDVLDQVIVRLAEVAHRRQSLRKGE